MSSVKSSISTISTSRSFWFLLIHTVKSPAFNTEKNSFFLWPYSHAPWRLPFPISSEQKMHQKVYCIPRNQLQSGDARRESAQKGREILDAAGHLFVRTRHLDNRSTISTLLCDTKCSCTPFILRISLRFCLPPRIIRSSFYSFRTARWVASLSKKL